MPSKLLGERRRRTLTDLANRLDANLIVGGRSLVPRNLTSHDESRSLCLELFHANDCSPVRTDEQNRFQFLKLGLRVIDSGWLGC
jgi:hypothetical protein